MSASAPGLGRSVLELAVDDKQWLTDLGRVKSTVLGLGTDFKTFGAGLSSTFNSARGSLNSFATTHQQSFKAVGLAAGIVVGAVGAVGAALVVMGQRGADVKDVQDAFNKFAGSGSLDALRVGVGGLLTDFDLMAGMNPVISAGFQLNATDAYTMARAAWVLADAQGIDLLDSYNQIAGAMATGKVASLEKLGLDVELKGATLAMKDALALEGEAITSSATKATARQAALEAMNRVVLAAGTAELDFGEKITRARVQLTNMTDSIGVAIATSPVVGTAMNFIGDALQGAFGAHQTTTIQTLIGIVNKLAIWLVDVAQVGVSTGKYLVIAYEGVKAILAGVATAVTFIAEMWLKGMGVMLAKASELPVVGQKFDGIAQSMRNAGVQMEGVRTSFQAQTTEAIDDAGRQGAAFDGVNTKLGDMKATMVAAAAQQVTNTTIAAGLAKQHGALAGETIKTGKATAEHAKEVKNLVEQMGGSKAIAAATVWLDALPLIGGLSKLTADEQKKLHTELGLALDGYAKMGIVAPAAMLDTWLATDKVTVGLGDLAGGIAGIGVQVETSGGEWMKNFDTVAAKFKTIQNEITLANKTGLDKRLLEIDIARQQEIAGLLVLKATHLKEYDELVLLVTQKYQLLTNAATGHHQTVGQLAQAAGFKTRTELQTTAATAIATYDAMLVSGQFTAVTLQAAFEAMEVAKRNAAETTTQDALSKFDLIANAAKSILGSMFGDNKKAAYAAAVINTAQAVTKTFAQFGWPFGIIPAAAALAAGYAQIRTIQNQQFRTGTAGLDFQNFGSRTTVDLHGQEAVIPRNKVHVLGGEIVRSMRAAGLQGGALGASASEMTQTIVFKVGERTITRLVARGLPRELFLKGVGA